MSLQRRFCFVSVRSKLDFLFIAFLSVFFSLIDTNYELLLFALHLSDWENAFDVIGGCLCLSDWHDMNCWESSLEAAVGA